MSQRHKLDLSDERFNREVIRGVEMMSPRPARKHTYTASRLTTEIGYRYYRGPQGPNRGPGGWVIQVGVSPSKELASNLLDDAKSKGGKALQSAKPYAVAFGSGSSQIYRARFGGFDDQRDAVNACNVLKRSGMKCWASAQ